MLARSVMESKSYTIFSIEGALYGIETHLVREIFLLPELTLIPEAPRDTIGVANLRGEILPIINLHARFFPENATPSYSVRDSIIAIANEERSVGILVQKILEVEDIPTAAIAPPLAENANFVAGIATIEDRLVTLLNSRNLWNYSQQYRTQTALPSFAPSDAERKIFRDRAENLRRVIATQDETDSIPSAVIAIGGEYFGVDLQLVREFTQVSHITPIPCTPPHIIGNINLRGDILTLIDIRTVLDLPSESLPSSCQAIVLCVEDIVAGIVVDEVLDISYISLKQIEVIPMAIKDREFLKGTAPYKDKMMAILNLTKILTEGGLFVEEEV